MGGCGTKVYRGGMLRARGFFGCTWKEVGAQIRNVVRGHKICGSLCEFLQRAGQSSTTSSKVDPFQIQRKMKPSKVPSMEQKREEIKLNIVLPQ